MPDLAAAPNPAPNPMARTPSPGPTGPAGVNVQNQGNLLRGKVLAGIAMTFLDQAHALLSSKTEEGQTVLKMITAGSKHFGPPPKELGMQELKLAQQRLSPMQGSPPMAAVQQRAGQLGMNVQPQPAGAAA